MISAIVISFFDHSYIKECIASLAFVDDIIIIGKIDPTVLTEIQHRQPIQFIESQYIDIDFLLEKASSNASHDWIVGLEANQCVSKELSEEITKIAMNTNISNIITPKYWYVYYQSTTSRLILSLSSV